MLAFESQHFVVSTCPQSLATVAARAMSFSVKGTATLQNGKVSLVLQPDAQDIRPDTNATGTGSDHAQFDVRAAMMQKIADGLMLVHPSRSPLSARTLLVHICHAQEKQQFTKKGMHGQWNLHAEAALAAALLKPKRKPTSSEPLALQNGTASSSSAPAPLAIENCKVPVSNTESSPKKTKPNDAKVDASSSSSSSTSSDEDLAKMDCSVVGGKKETVGVKTKPNDAKADTSSSSSSSNEDEQEEAEDEQEETEDEQEEAEDEQQEQDVEQAMPDYSQWTDDWHDVYAQLLQIYDRSELNAKRRRIMDTLLADLRKAKGHFDAAL